MPTFWSGTGRINEAAPYITIWTQLVHIHSCYQSMNYGQSPHHTPEFRQTKVVSSVSTTIWWRIPKAIQTQTKWQSTIPNRFNSRVQKAPRTYSLISPSFIYSSLCGSPCSQPSSSTSETSTCGCRHASSIWCFWPRFLFWWPFLCIISVSKHLLHRISAQIPHWDHGNLHGRNPVAASTRLIWLGHYHPRQCGRILHSDGPILRSFSLRHSFLLSVLSIIYGVVRLRRGNLLVAPYAPSAKMVQIPQAASRSEELSRAESASHWNSGHHALDFTVLCVTADVSGVWYGNDAWSMDHGKCIYAGSAVHQPLWFVFILNPMEPGSVLGRVCHLPLESSFQEQRQLWSGIASYLGLDLQYALSAVCSSAMSNEGCISCYYPSTAFVASRDVL